MFYQPQLTPVYVTNLTQGPPVYFNQLQEEYPQTYAVDQGSVTDQSFDQSKKPARFSPYKWFLYLLTLAFLLTVLGLTIAIIVRANRHHNIGAQVQHNQGVLRSFYRNRNKDPIVHLSLSSSRCSNITEVVDVYRFPPTRNQLNLETRHTFSPYLNGKFVCVTRDPSYRIADTCPSSAPNRHGNACSTLAERPVTKVSIDATGNLVLERSLSEDPVVDLELYQNGKPCADPSKAPSLKGNNVVGNINLDFSGCGSVDNERSNLHLVDGFSVPSNTYFSQLQTLDNSYNLSQWYPNLTNQSSSEVLNLYYERKTPYPVHSTCNSASSDLERSFSAQTVSNLDYYLWQVKVFAAVALAFTCLAIVLWVLFAVLRKHLARRYLIVYLVAAIVAAIIIILGIWYFAHGRHNQGFVEARRVRQIRSAGCLDSFGNSYKNAADSLANSVRHFSYVNPLIIALFVIGIIYLIVLALGLIIGRKF